MILNLNFDNATDGTPFSSVDPSHNFFNGGGLLGVNVGSINGVSADNERHARMVAEMPKGGDCFVIEKGGA